MRLLCAHIRRAPPPPSHCFFLGLTKNVDTKSRNLLLTNYAHAVSFVTQTFTQQRHSNSKSWSFDKWSVLRVSKQSLRNIFSIMDLKKSITILIWISGHFCLGTDVYKLADELRNNMKGYVFLRGSPEYESARAVHNGACRNIFPLLITKPLVTEDVSVIVKTSVKYNIALSVRSGGHSFQCQGTKVCILIFQPSEFHFSYSPFHSQIQFTLT